MLLINPVDCLEIKFLFVQTAVQAPHAEVLLITAIDCTRKTFVVIIPIVFQLQPNQF
jgi:hypothetical protein